MEIKSDFEENLMRNYSSNSCQNCQNSQRQYDTKFDQLTESVDKLKGVIESLTASNAEQSSLILNAFAKQEVLIEKLLGMDKEEDKIRTMFPISSLEELSLIDNGIKATNRSIYTRVISSLLKGPLHKSLTEIFSVEVILACNLDGIHGKVPFKDFKRLFDALMEAVFATGQDNPEKAIRNGLKLIKKRHFQAICVNKKKETKVKLESMEDIDTGPETLIGTRQEKQIYKNMSPTEFVQRLLVKRCVSFVGFFDSYILITGETGHGDSYLKVGTDEEEAPLTLNNVLSYDEIKISALLSVASHTEFLNVGNRLNCGKIEQDLNKIEKNGVVVGLIGARFAQPHRMEYEDIKITKQQNTIENGYGCNGAGERAHTKSLWRYLFPSKDNKLIDLRKDYRCLWNKFYEEEDHLYQKFSADNKRFGECYKRDEIFDNLIMKKRFAISFDLLLLEANERALKQQKLAYIHVVGIGLGVWLAAPQQEKIFMECFQQRLKYLIPELNNIGVIHFSWFQLTEWKDLKNEAVLKSETHTGGGIKILISKRNPNEKLPAPYENMLPVVSFAWDGNALPGNEFWMGSLYTSNDPSAACSTLITEIFNPHINSKYVNGNNLHIASIRYGIVHVKDYVENILNEQSNNDYIK